MKRFLLLMFAMLLFCVPASGSSLGPAAGDGTVAVWPAFGAFLSGNQTISSSSAIKIQFDTEHFDTNSDYDTSNYRFTPTVAGKYLINVRIELSSCDTGSFWTELHRNGAMIRQMVNIRASSSRYIQDINILDMNGSTDYVEVFIDAGTDTAYTVRSNTINVTFEATRVSD